MGRLTLEGNDKPFSPGDTLRGHVDGLPSGSKLSVAFGPRERLLSDKEEDLPELEHGPREDGEASLKSLVQVTGDTTFSFKVPDGPFSFQGKKIALEWVVQAKSGDWEAREAVTVAPGSFTGKPNLAGDLDEELEVELHWAYPILHYFGAGLLAAAGLVAAITLGFSAIYPFAAAALWAAIAWGRHRWAKAAGTGKMVFNARGARPGERLSVKGTVVSPRTLEEAKLVLSLACDAEFSRSKEDSKESDSADERVWEKKQERPLGTLSAGAPAAFDAAWELPAGPFSYALGEDLSIQWWVNVELVSKGVTVNEWSEPVDLWP